MNFTCSFTCSTYSAIRSRYADILRRSDSLSAILKTPSRRLSSYVYALFTHRDFVLQCMNTPSQNGDTYQEHMTYTLVPQVKFGLFMDDKSSNSNSNSLYLVLILRVLSLTLFLNRWNWSSPITLWNLSDHCCRQLFSKQTMHQAMVLYEIWSEVVSTVIANTITSWVDRMKSKDNYQTSSNNGRSHPFMSQWAST